MILKIVFVYIDERTSSEGRHDESQILFADLLGIYFNVYFGKLRYRYACANSGGKYNDITLDTTSAKISGVAYVVTQNPPAGQRLAEFLQEVHQAYPEAEIAVVTHGGNSEIF